jgi:anti-sigma regulatory factor (Ser/Thr protein kinase)
LKELSLHLLDIAENSIAAGAKNIRIYVGEDSRSDLLQMSVSDDGRGMSKEMAEQATDPFITTRTTRKVGLGIPLLKLAAEACNGYLAIDSQPGKGTNLVVQFQRNHIDRMPMGDLVSTILHLVIANPQIHWRFEYRFNDRSAVFDDAVIKQELGDIPLTEPTILAFLKEMIHTMIMEINPQFQQHTYTIQN